MKVYTRTIIDWINDRYIVIAENSRLCFGPVAYCKGATAEQKDIAASNAAFNKTLQGAYSQAFANQQAIFSAVKAVYDPIMAAGPGQYGFSAAEDAALRTQASEATAGQYRMASSTLAEQLAARGGGNSFLPSGVDANLRANLAGSAAATESGRQLDITKAGYATGRENFLQASNAELGIAAAENPLGYAGAAINSGKSAFDMASEIQKANAAASPWGTIGGIAGGILGSFAGPAGAAIGTKIGGFLGNAGSVGARSGAAPGTSDPGFGGVEWP